MGCSTSTQTTAQDTTRQPSSKPEESNGTSTTGAANENGKVAEDSETIPDHTVTVAATGGEAKSAPAAATGGEAKSAPAAAQAEAPAAETPAQSETQPAAEAPAAATSPEQPASSPEPPPAAQDPGTGRGTYCRHRQTVRGCVYTGSPIGHIFPLIGILINLISSFANKNWTASVNAAKVACSKPT
nr:mucin-1-like [Oncorhynchus nerka]